MTPADTATPAVDVRLEPIWRCEWCCGWIPRNGELEAPLCPWSHGVRASSVDPGMKKGSDHYGQRPSMVPAVRRPR
jgi:hypothetical protein